MLIQISGWKKIYLFYGVIFFSMGLLGFIFNSRVALPQLARFILDDFSGELAEVGLIRSRESRSVIVINPRLSPVVLISLIDNGEPGYRATVDRIHKRMARKSRVIHYPVSGKDWLKSPPIRSLINKNRFLVGVESAGAMDSDRISIVFTIPKPMIVKFFNELLTKNPELPLFQLVQIYSQPNSLYRFSFTKPSVSYAHWTKVIDTLLETWKTEESQRIDHTFSF